MRLLALLLLLPLAARSSSTVVIRVAPTAGAAPVPANHAALRASSIHEAQMLARAASAATRTAAAIQGAVRVELEPGVHELRETLHLDARDSGVTWAAATSTAATSVSGGRVVKGWTACPFDASLWCAPVTFANASLAQPRHLYVGGVRAPRHRAPDSVAAAFAHPISVDNDKVRECVVLLWLWLWLCCVVAVAVLFCGCGCGCCGVVALWQVGYGED